MPLLYGEGKKAFVRLQEAILSENEDHSLFAWNPLTDAPPDLGENKGAATTGTSIFAEHPRHFAHAGHIRSLVPQGGGSFVTNKGVSIELPVLHIRSLPEDVITEAPPTPVFLIILSCGEGESSLRRMGIIVRRLNIDQKSHTYIRHETAKIYTVQNRYVKSDIRQLYLRKHPRQLGDIRYKHKLNKPASFVEARSYWPKDILRLEL